MKANHAGQPTGAFGIDIGGSGIKGAPVDLIIGELSAERVRVPTPDPSTPKAVAKAVAELVDSFDLPRNLPIGVTFPAAIVHGVAKTAANVDESWIGTDVSALIGKHTGRSVFAVNDADAAGYAEVLYGAARGVRGTVLLITLGTGIGSGLIVDGVLVPNTEFGHLQIDGKDAEERASDAARERHSMSWAEWAKHLQRYFRTLEDLIWPDLIVIGGGVSKKHDNYLPLLRLRTPIVPAGLFNNAGIVGAAGLAARAGKGARSLD
jgi:polyphosphate glucokinase